MTIKTDLDAKIYIALRDRLESMSGGYDVYEPGKTLPTAADTAFLLVQDVRFDPDPVFTNAASEDFHTGEFNVAVMTPLAWTHAQTLGIAGLIRAHMPKGYKAVVNDVTVTIRETPFYAGTAYRDQAWNRLPVSVRWRAWG